MSKRQFMENKRNKRKNNKIKDMLLNYNKEISDIYRLNKDR